MLATIFESAAIILREGLEAMLVLAALAAFLSRSGEAKRTTPLYWGAALAVAASILLAWTFQQFNNGMHDDLLEGVVLLIAAALMFYVSGWLFLKQDPRNWQAYLKSQTAKATAAGSGAAIGLLAFLAVFREGAETALFLHALAKTKGGWSLDLAIGISIATIGLAAIWYVITKTTQRLPLRSVFLLTSAFLFVMALRFVGQAFQEFQEQSLLSYHPAPFARAIEAIGFNATWEAVGTQLLLMGLSAVAAIWTVRSARRRVEP